MLLNGEQIFDSFLLEGLDGLLFDLRERFELTVGRCGFQRSVGEILCEILLNVLKFIDVVIFINVYVLMCFILVKMVKHLQPNPPLRAGNCFFSLACGMNGFA